MSIELRSFIPEELKGESIRIDESLIPVVEHISAYLTPQEIWQYFSQSPETTGVMGKRKFPYYRVDSGLMVCNGSLYFAEKKANDNEDYLSDYEKASRQAMRLVLWVEVGFEGLHNLALHPSSKNWTGSGVGHFFETEEERVQAIMTGGKDSYNKVLREFVAFRDSHGITEDCFTEHGLEGLLTQWRGESNL